MPSHREEYPLNPFRFVTNETGVFRRAFSSLPNSLRKYSFTGIIMLFFTFSIFGWVWEVLLELVTNGILVNRGTMHGPWLPIYGVGGVLVLLMLRPWRKHPVVTFALACAVCGTLEYIASWLLEQIHGTKWWDYSGYFLNLNGRICLEGVLVFGIGSVAFIYFLAPWFDELYKKHISQNIRIILCTLLAALFIIDFAYSNKNPNTGEGITDYGMQPAAAQSVSDAPAFAPTE